jgi:hypothetical protein
MDRKIFENWFQEPFVSEVLAFLTHIGLPKKAVLLLDNALSHPRQNILTSNNVLIVLNVLPPSVTATVQTMDQEMIVSMKCHYQVDLLRTTANENDSIMALWRNK